MLHRRLSLLLGAVLCTLLLGSGPHAETTDAASLSAAAQAPSVEITMHRGRVLLRTAPWTDFVIWRVDEFNRIVGRWPGTTSSSGSYLMALVLNDKGDRPVIDPLEAGQRLFVDMSGGDPIVFTLPELTVRADPVNDMLSGEAPPGSRLSVNVSLRDEVLWQRDEVVVGPSGAWSVSTAGEHDLVDESRGRVTLLREDGHRVGIDWVAPLVRVDLDTGHLHLKGPLHRLYQAKLIAADGMERARVEGRSDSGSHAFASWEAWLLTDVLGKPVHPQPGDRLEGFFGDDEIRFEIPRLEAVLEGRTDRVRGSSSAAAGTRLQLRLSSFVQGSDTWEVELDEDGRFEVDLSTSTPPWTLRPNDYATLELRPPGASVLRHTAIPGMVLHLDGARVDLILAPRERATISHQRGTGVLGRLEVTADELGSVDTALTKEGAPWDLREGDALLLEVDRRDGPLSTNLPIPRMSLSLELEANEMRGCAILPPGSRYILRMMPFNRSWEEVLSWLGGCFELRFDEHPSVDRNTGQEKPIRLAPGHSATATAMLASGHVIELRSRLARFHLQPESAEVCVEGNPHVQITLEGDTTDGASASASAWTDEHGRARLSLRDGSGEPRAIARGHRLKAIVEDTSYDITVPPFRVEPDWLFHDLVVHGIPGMESSAEFPGRVTDCFGSQVFAEDSGPNWGWTSRAAFDESGQTFHNLVDLVDGHDADLRQGLVLEHPTLEGHRTYLRLYPLHLEAYLGTDRVIGWGAQGETVNLSLLDADDRERGAGSATIEPSGAFALRLEGGGEAEAEPIYLQSGQRLEAGTPTDQSGFVLPPLDFDWSEAAGLDGDTVPGAQVSVTFRLADGQERHLSRTADADGSFTFRPSEIPAAEPWRTADVTGLRAAIEVDAWHTAVRTWPTDPDAPEPTAAPPVPTETPAPVPSDTPPAPSGTATPVEPAPTAMATQPNRPPIVLRRVVWLPWAKR